MTNDSVTPLHVRSGYSLLRGTVGLGRLVELARALGHEHLALTDVNGLYGATAFYKLADQGGLKPIIGAELAQGGLLLVALVESDEGYENLCRLITRIHRPAGQSKPSVGDFAALSAGLNFIVEDEPLADGLLAAGMDRGRLWLGIDPAVQSHVQLRRLAKCADRLGVAPVATGGALMGEPDERDVARLLAAIRVGATFDTVAADQLPHARAVLRDGAQLAGELVDFPDAVRNNRRLAERCAAFKLLPRRPVFPAFLVPDGQTPAGYLRRLCRLGMERRYGRNQPPGADDRLERELSLIEQMGFSEYFLVVWDIVQYALRQQVPVAGRGSGASSLVAYLLGITNVCPLACDIPFERFLNEQREDFPDLDIDFCWRIRDDVIEYAFGRWGEDHVAMVSMHGTFQPRSAVRETAKAFGLSNEQISRLERAGPSLDDDVRSMSRVFSSSSSGLPDDISQRILKLSRRILSLPHNLSVHPGGIVIGREPIDYYVPVQEAAKEFPGAGPSESGPKAARAVPITQYDKDGVEDIGLVKLDLLGNRNLSTIRYACKLIGEHRGRRVDIESLPPADTKTIELLRSAKTVGCNQLESPAMRHLLRMMRPSCRRDLMKVLALIRPGAASLGMKETFVRRHRGLEETPPAPAGVRAVLGDTHGVMLYEDDVMLAASAMLGCSLAEADRFRRAVQKCRTDDQRLVISREFLGRCVANGIDLDYAKSMWVQMAKYNAYSFCRAHAASYALLAYAAAYLRAHWPLEFWTAALNNNQSMYHPRVYVEQAKRSGIRFLLPDVNRSGEEFSMDSTDATGGAIRVGLNFVAGLGPVGAGEVLAGRAGRPFDGLSDFLTRTHLGEQEVRSLILCGAFDGFGRARPALMMESNLFRRLGPVGSAHQPALLQACPVIESRGPETSGFLGCSAPPGDYSPARKYFDERRVLGISVGPHPMTLYRTFLEEAEAPGHDAPRFGPPTHVSNVDNVGDIDSRQLEACRGRRVRIAGLLEAQRTARSQRGGEMMFLTLDDEYGLFEVTLFPDLRRPVAGGFRHYGPYVVAGKVEDQYDALSITAQSVEYFDVPDEHLKTAMEFRESG